VIARVDCVRKRKIRVNERLWNACRAAHALNGAPTFESIRAFIDMIETMVREEKAKPVHIGAAA
jgi:hypothetical protein